MLPANDLFLEDSIEKRLSIVSDDETINLTNEDIHSEQFQLKESICSEQSLKFGSCEANSIEFTIANTVPTMTGKWLTVTITPYNRNGTAGTAMTLGRFKVFSDKPSADREKRTVIAYDKLFYVCKKNYRRWYRRTVFSGHTTLTVKQFRDAFFTKIGITQDTVTLPNDGVSIKKAKVPSKLTGKDILTAICEINGVFGHIGRDNNFKYLSLSTNTSPTAIGKTYTISVEYSDNTLPAVDRIEMLGKDGEIVASVGSGEDNYTNKYTIDNNFIVNGMLSKSHYESALQTLSLGTTLFSLVPLTAEMKGHPRYEVGDRITYSVGNTTKTSFILNRTMKGIQDLRDTYDSMIEEYYSNEPNAVNTKTAQMQSMEYQIGAMEDMTEVHLEKLDDGSVVVRDESLASDEDNGSWNTKVFWLWTQNDLIVSYNHTWSVFDICIKCDYPFLVCDMPYEGGGAGIRIADINGKNYYESMVALVVRTNRGDPAPTIKQLMSFHQGNREQSRQIYTSYIWPSEWGTWQTKQSTQLPIYVGDDYAYYYFTYAVGAPYSGMYGLCKPDKHYSSWDLFWAALQAGEINPPNTKNGDVILPKGSTQKETGDALQELANAVGGESGGSYDPGTEMQVEPDSSTDVESENNQKSIANSIKQITQGLNNWIGSIVNKGRGNVVAEVKKKDGTLITQIKASTNLVTVSDRTPTDPGEVGDLHCVIADESGIKMSEQAHTQYTIFDFSSTKYGYMLAADAILADGNTEYGGKVTLKIDGLTANQQYVFTYKACAFAYSSAGGHENVEYRKSGNDTIGPFGILFHDESIYDESTLPVITNSNYWDSTLQWQNFNNIQRSYVSFSNTVTATASTMYMHLYLEPIKKYEDKEVRFLITDLKTAEMNITFNQLWAQDPDGYWMQFAGGGGGTSDYDDLENQPQVNSVTLIGNKTTRDLGIFEKKHLSEFEQLTQAQKDDPDKFYFVDDAGGSGGGGSSTLAGLTDVSITSPSNGQVLAYDSQNSVWVNSSGGGGTNVVPNPSGDPTATLEKIGISGTVYDIKDVNALHPEDVGATYEWTRPTAQNSIVTDIVPTITDRIEMQYIYDEINSSWGLGTTPIMFYAAPKYYYRYFETNSYELSVGNSGSWTIWGSNMIKTPGHVVTVKYNEDFTSHNVYIYDETAETVMKNQQAMNYSEACTGTLVFFNDAQSGSNTMYSKLKYFKIWDATTQALKHHFVPIADGLYDLVTGTAYPYTNSNYENGNVTGYLDFTRVEANPAETPTDVLEAIKIADTTYSLGVAANPSGSPTATLTKLQVGETIYNVAGGGGGGGHSLTAIWDYVNDNSGNVLFGTFTKTLHDDINNYDKIIMEVMSSSADSGNWDATEFYEFSVTAINAAKNPGRITINTYDTRSSSYYIHETTLQKIADNGSNINGLVRVYGVKSGGGSGSGSPEKIVLYNTETSSVGTEITLSDDISNYESLEFVVGFNSSDKSKVSFRYSVEDFKADFPYTGSTANTNPQFITCVYGTYYMCFQCGSADNKIYIVRGSDTVLYSINGINYGGGSDQSYSTTERQIGTWIDGKPLYQITQVYDKTTINTSTKQFAHNVANIDQICGMECLYSFSGYQPTEKYMAMLPWCYNENNSSNNNYYGGYRIGKDKIFVQIGNSLYGDTNEWTFTFKYTKTTDL